jgi:S1-C subfamily serine protease
MDPSSTRTRIAAFVFAAGGLLASALPLRAADDPGSSAAPSAIELQARALQRAHAAVVGVHTLAVDEARSATTLGREREGSGVVIEDGLVLTIGYLILEAEQVELFIDPDRIVPARVIAYDVATGFGLLQPLAPLRVEPVVLGEAGTLNDGAWLMVASGGTGGDVSMARMVSRRPFSGYWEYHIESALFTSPPRTDHSGAALFNDHGELVGIGSLLVNEALGPGKPKLPGNMFVPVDLLKPILAEMRSRGQSHLSQRAWIGLNCAEVEGEVRVLRVNDDSPGDVAGLQPGDRIARIDGKRVRSLEGFYKALWDGGAPEREVQLEVRRGDETKQFKVQSVDRMKTLRRATGI